MPWIVIPTFGRKRQEDQELKAILEPWVWGHTQLWETLFQKQKCISLSFWHICSLFLWLLPWLPLTVFQSGFYCSLFKGLFAHILMSVESVSHRTAARTLLAAKVIILPRFLCSGYRGSSSPQILLPSQAELLDSLETSVWVHQVSQLSQIVFACLNVLLKHYQKHC